MWFDLIKLLVTIAQHKKEVNIEQRERVSKMYFQMSELLLDVIKDFKNDVYPSGKCATMWALSENVLNYLQDKVNTEELNMLHDMLHSCSQLEKEYALRKEPQIINAIIDASGRLHALSILYSV
jgi:hypothetical protein